MIYLLYWLAASVLFLSGYVYRVAMERSESESCGRFQ